MRESVVVRAALLCLLTLDHVNNMSERVCELAFSSDNGTVR